MSVSMLLEMAVAGHGDRIALGSRADGITFAELGRRAGGGAALIGERAPDHVVFVGRNGPAFPQVLFSAATAGVPFVPINYRLSVDSVHDLISDLTNPFLVVDPDYAHLAPSGVPVITTADFTARAADTAPIEAPYVDDASTAVLLFTSGTTSRPKAVVLRHENLVSYILSTVDFGSADVNDASLVAVPPYHVAAVGSVLSNLYAGRRVVYLPDFDARTWLDLVRTEEITTAMVVPTMLARVVEILGDDPADLPSLRLISYGGSRIPLPVLEHALRVFPDVGFVNAYGLTETSSTIALLGPEDHRAAAASSDADTRARLASVGRPVPGVEIEIRDEEGAPVAVGGSGALWVRGPQVSGSYLGSGSMLDAEGWFHTRDQARFDDEGFLFIEGRQDDTIIRGGENIAPAEIEDVLVHHPGVREAAVVGRPDDEWGERIVAVVVRRPGAVVSSDEIRAYVRERLRGSRTPDEVVWSDELPHSATGKLLRRELLADLP